MFLPHHDNELELRAWLRSVRVVAEGELEPVRSPLPHPSRANASAQVILGDVGQPSPPLQVHSVGNVLPVPVVEPIRFLHLLGRPPDFGLAQTIVRDSFPSAICRERTMKARMEVMLGRPERKRGQALQHCVSV